LDALIVLSKADHPICIPSVFNVEIKVLKWNSVYFKVSLLVLNPVAFNTKGLCLFGYMKQICGHE